MLTRILVFTLMFSFAGTGVHGRKVGMKLKAPKEKKRAALDKQKTTKKDDEVFLDLAKGLTFFGYDKKTNSAIETFFISNNSHRGVKGIELQITYVGSNGEDIHKRKVDISESIPAGETRKIDIQSWDKQKSFHYKGSAAGKNGSAPYSVRFKVISLIPE